MSNRNQTTATMAIAVAFVLLGSFATFMVAPSVAFAQQTGEYCFNDVQDGVVVGVTCFADKEQCKDFRNAIKGDDSNTRYTACKAV